MHTGETLTFSDLLSMRIEDRKILARKLLSQGAVSDGPRHIEREWGRFEDIPALGWGYEDAEAEKLLSTMTVRQKIGQMTPNTTIEEYIPACIKYNDAPYYAGEDIELDIPGIKFTDGPTGIVMGNSSTCFPVSIGRGATWDIELEKEIGDAIGVEARALGANFFGGVCVNLLRHPSWGRSQETYGEDPYLLGAMGSALVQGVQRHAMACVKHFALNSMENSRYKVDVTIDERSLREIYLPHFKACLDAGAAAVMAAYNKFQGKHCGENAYLLKTILRDEWKFEGIVISDFIHGIRDGKNAVLAGMDIEMPVAGHFGENLYALWERGEVPEALIDDAVRSILRTKIRFAKRLGAGPYMRSSLACPAHVALARKAALESTVLLKNERNFLPFAVESQKKIAIVGRLASAANIGEMKGSSHVYPPYVVTPLEGIREKIGDRVEVAYADGEDEDELRAAVLEADAVVVVVGLTSDDEGEYIPHWSSGCGGDRIDLGLKSRDVDIIRSAVRLNGNVAVVLQGGGAIMTDPWDREVRSILMQWYPGMEGGTALADILYGDYNPSGKLPLTVPKTYRQLPHFDRDTEKITYDFYHGYFLIDSAAHHAAYPFGFGKSYTTFEYSGLVVSPAQIGTMGKDGEGGEFEVRVRVKNTGGRSGEEVVQIYAGYEGSCVPRHVKDLKGFGRVALEPGEEKEFSRTVKLCDLAYYSVEEHRWIVEKIDYLIHVGASSRPQDLITARLRVR
ncbi:MAG: glycoside hydrolase family 3 C-terminal domain-containing protein [Rectinemataceae bacterium]